jgi:hypothetical protein
MNPSRPHPTVPALKAAVCTAAVALAFAGCDDRLAGSSVGTGNPTEIQVGFRDSAGAASVKGTLSVYAARQIPVEGYRPAPVLDYRLDGNGNAILKASDFEALPDSVWPKGSDSAGARSFNIQILGEDKGALLTGFVYHKDKHDFTLEKDEAPAWETEGSRALLAGTLSALTDMSGTLDTTGFSAYKSYRLFIYGTGYSAPLSSGKFTFSRIPRGSYQPFLISLPMRDHLSGGSDSTDIFRITGTLSSSGPDSLARGAFFDRVRLPDSLLPH